MTTLVGLINFEIKITSILLNTILANFCANKLLVSFLNELSATTLS